MRHTWNFLSVIALMLVLAACSSDVNTESVDAAAGALVRGRACHRPTEPTPPIPAARCLFGEQFSDIRGNAALELTREMWIRSVEALTPLAGAQLLRAVQQSSHTDVTTPGEALARVDQQEVRRIDLIELASGREFVVFEYGVGDNSYGAFFRADSEEVVASIHDGDLLDCSVEPLGE